MIDLGTCVCLCVTQGCERYILPSLVSRASSEASSLIRLLTNLLAVTVSIFSTISLIYKKLGFN